MIHATTRNDTKNPAWYRVQTWARQNNWERECGDQHHMSFSRGDDCVQVTFHQGRVESAEWHRHQPDDTMVMLGEIAKDDPGFIPTPATVMREWFTQTE